MTLPSQHCSASSLISSQMFRNGQRDGVDSSSSFSSSSRSSMLPDSLSLLDAGATLSVSVSFSSPVSFYASTFFHSIFFAHLRLVGPCSLLFWLVQCRFARVAQVTQERCKTGLVVMKLAMVSNKIILATERLVTFVAKVHNDVCVRVNKITSTDECCSLTASIYSLTVNARHAQTSNVRLQLTR